MTFFRVNAPPYRLTTPLRKYVESNPLTCPYHLFNISFKRRNYLKSNVALVDHLFQHSIQPTLPRIVQRYSCLHTNIADHRVSLCTFETMKHFRHLLLTYITTYIYTYIANVYFINFFEVVNFKTQNR